ncbi:hypothetical protein [Pseudorhodoplanes sp.]|uniref:hypothetical protein n=1 Tax=Pseudorhodoplanes sp. TaxID=1934341 RepID=UPI002D0F04F0|nr:hypothetical protein [Pseudorhodoplanes sp.]HWV44080.1 hypothetical protein [Pseudorhodoplanes sp.]
MTAPNPVSVRRRHKIIAQPKARVERRRVLETANRLVTESDWRGDLARSVLDVIETEEHA